MTAASPPANNRFDEDSELMIDAMRGMAALLVLVTHAFDLAVVDVFGSDLASSPEGWRWARASAGHGGFWVWCFFVISGLCIHQSIARSVAAGTFQWRRYFLARVTRIYPLFLLGLAVAMVVWLLREDWNGGVPDPTPWRQLGASLASLQILTTTFPGFETSWSLSCEMIYYVAWPMLVLSLRGRLAPAVYLALCASFAVLGGILLMWRVMHVMEHSAAIDGIWTTAVLFPVWVSGAWLAGHWSSASARIARKMWLGSIVLCALAECLLILLKFYQLPGWSVHLASWASIPGLLIFLAGARHGHLSSFAWARPACRWLGQFSYPCYILHMQVLLIWNHFLVPVLPKSIASNPLLDFLLLFLPVLGLLVLAGPRLERVTMRWRSQVLKSVEATSAPVPAA